MTKVVTVDLGGTHIRVARVENNKIVKYIKKATPKNKKDILNELCRSIDECLTKGVKGIAISYAGHVENNVVKISPNLPLKGINLERFLQKKYKMKIVIENDANCAAIAEIKFGIKKKNFFVLTIGTGIGGGIVVDGKLFKGSNCGGELGHIILNNRKDFEYHYQRSKNNKEKLADILGQGIASLVSVFDPEIVVLSGGLKRYAGLDFIKKIRKKTQKYMFLHRSPQINWSKLKHPETMGASTLID